MFNFTLSHKSLVIARAEYLELAISYLVSRGTMSDSSRLRTKSIGSWTTPNLLVMSLM